MEAGLAIDAESKRAFRAVAHTLIPINERWALTVKQRARDHICHGLERRLQQLTLVLCEEIRRNQGSHLSGERKDETTCVF